MSFTLLVTYQRRLQDSKQILMRIGIMRKCDSMFPFYINDNESEKEQLSKLIRDKKPSLIILDTRIDEAILRSWFSEVIQDTLAEKALNCDIYSFGQQNYELPGVVHYYPDYQPPP